MRLFIGLYDYSYGKNAYEYDGETLIKKDLSSEQYEVACYHSHLNEEQQKIYNDLLSNYEKVILCEDGIFEILK